MPKTSKTTTKPFNKPKFPKFDPKDPRFDKTPRKCIIAASEGWVFVGMCYFDEERGAVLMENAYNIRKWGTEHGLAELTEGPLSETVLDEFGDVCLFSIIFVLEINPDKW